MPLDHSVCRGENEAPLDHEHEGEGSGELREAPSAPGGRDQGRSGGDEEEDEHHGDETAGEVHAILHSGELL